VPTLSTDKSGAQYIFDNGGYRQVTPKESDILNMPAWQVVGSSALNLLEFAGSTLAAGQLSQTPQGAEVSQIALQNSMQALQRQGELGRLRPGAAELGGELLLGGIPAIGSFGSRAINRAVRSIPGELAEDVTGSLPSRAVRTAAKPTVAAPITEGNAQVVQDLGGMVGNFGADTAGAASQGGFWSALRRMPKFNQMLEGLEDFIGKNSPMTSAQVKHLTPDADGITAVDRVGLRLLPGQANGNGVITEVISRDPLMRDAFNDTLSANSDTLMTKMSRSLGIEPGNHGRDFKQLGRAAQGENFETVTAALDGIDLNLGDDLVNTLNDEVFNTGELAKFIDEGRLAGGSDIKEVRELIAEELAGARTDKAGGRRARLLNTALDEFDDNIEQQLVANGDEAVLALWQEARQRWRLVRALDRSTSFSKDGELSIKGLVNNLEREFPVEFSRSTLTINTSGMPDDMVDLLDFTRVSRDFMSNLNDSGTGTTNALLQAISNPKVFAQKRLASKFISDVLLNNPTATTGI